jgi:tetratricopeptide (TPR) repeat protein
MIVLTMDRASLVRHRVSLLIIPLLTIIPLFFLPFTQDYYDTNKWYLLAVLALCIVLFSGITLIRKSCLTISLSPLSAGLTLCTLAALLSLGFTSVNRTEALLMPFGPVTFTAFTLIALFSPVFLTPLTKRLAVWCLYLCALILALITLYQQMGIGKFMFPGVPFLGDALWTPTGSTLGTAAILTIFLPLLALHAFGAVRQKKEAHAAFLIIVGLVTAAGLGVALWQMVPRLAGTLLPLRAGWVITLELLKNPLQAAFGIGAENFLTAFTFGRPLSFNLTPLWSVRFTTNSTLFFHILSTYGLAGAGSFLVLAWSIIRRRGLDVWFAALAAGLLSFFLLPPNLSVFTVVILLSLVSPYPHREYTINLQGKAGWLRYAAMILALAFVGAAGILLFRTYSAEYTFHQSLLAAKAGNGTLTYNLQTKAIDFNPRVSRFHMIFSQTNMALATSLAKTITPVDTTGQTGADAFARDRELVSQLVQQSIKEAKLAAQLNTLSILAWENLARTYQQLIGVAQGADTWAVSSFRQAMALDPTNPVLPLELGSVLIALKQYPAAITEFQRAVALKNNYTNAYFNLANAYKLNNDSTQAVAVLERAQILATPGSEDYNTIQKELQNLKNTPPAALKP